MVRVLTLQSSNLLGMRGFNCQHLSEMEIRIRESCSSLDELILSHEEF